MIEILLATFNGEKYLQQQLDSIKNQTYKNWKILARDDGSTDATVEILNSFKKSNPGKIEIHLNLTNKHGPASNFSELINLSKSNYIAFCDQDDVWTSSKLEKSLNCLKQLEKNLGNLPILVHTDLFIVDKFLNVQFNSMVKIQKLNYSANKTIKQLIVQNCATGCTMLMNRELINVCDGQIPEGAVMHDWWLALVACAFGRLWFLNESTVFYRQHESNALGCKPLGLDVNNQSDLKRGEKIRKIQLSKKFKFYRLFKLFSVFFWFNFSRNLINLFFKSRKTIHQNLKDTFIQAEVFLKKYYNKLNSVQLNMLKKYVSLHKGKKIRRIFNLFRSGYLKKGFLKKMSQIFFI